MATASFHPLASSSVPTAPMTAMPPTPRTLLPSDPSSLKLFLHASHLAHLQRVYESKLHQIDDDAKTAAGGGGAAGGSKRRQRKRRGSSPPTTGRDSDDDDADDAAHTSGADKGKKRKVAGIDEAHAYDVVYDLAPNGSSDSYYHGTHPAPPAKVVRAVLRAAKHAPLFDPDGVSVVQLDQAAAPVWEQEGAKGATKEATDEWEENIIAAFSTNCDKRISTSIANLPQSMRPVFAAPTPAPPSAATQGAGVGVGVGGGQATAHQQQATAAALRQQSPFAEHGHQTKEYWRSSMFGV
ncbi:hypothetical protein MNV49_001532 [Pseudohyphozyma bogoriensis]|nr:hypothetical protein MNV49_001532 [Pseudohyphozyma bogoriensis]